MSVLVRLGRFPEALEGVEIALAITKLQPTGAIYIQTDFHAMTVVHDTMGNLQEALVKRQEAWQVLDESEHTEVVAAAKCLMIMVSTYKQSLELLRRTNKKTCSLWPCMYLASQTS